LGTSKQNELYSKGFQPKINTKIWLFNQTLRRCTQLQIATVFRGNSRIFSSSDEFPRTHHEPAKHISSPAKSILLAQLVEKMLGNALKALAIIQVLPQISINNNDTSFR
jgi:hypothetical protein